MMAQRNDGYTEEIMTTQPLTLIGRRYQVIAELGTGGMGTVYRVQDRLTGHIVALKQMLVRADQRRPSTPADSAVLAQEFKILGSLRHPHIISVLDYGFDGGGQPFYTMTLLDGVQNFVEVAQRRDLDAQIDLLLQILQALAYLHRRGILHRDLKPANVLIDADGQVKVVDFGLAVVVDQVSAPAGTLDYMAPEVLNGQRATIQSDLYAVGVMAYELFAGRRPFNTGNFLALMYKAFSEPPDFGALPISPALVAVIEKLLTPVVADRYASAEAVIGAFAQATGHSLSPETQATRESFLQAAQFVGRQAELALLNDALKCAAESAGSAWLIGGESGVGKSRLLDELQTQALLRGALVIRCGAVAEGGTPYQIWREAIRRLVLQTELTHYEASVLKPIVPDIGRLLERAVSDPPPVDAQSLQTRLWAVIKRLFDQKQLTVLLLEDLQWADESLSLLTRLLELASRAPLLIVGAYRDDERPALPTEFPGAQSIKLARFSTDSIAQLSQSMLGEAGHSSNVLGLLERETEGNVYFIVEVLRTLAEEAGGLANIGRETLPSSVFAGGMRTVMQRRVARTPESARPLLTVAAIVGRELDLKILHHVAPALDLDSWLQQVANLIDVQDNRYRFAHDKLREAILIDLEANERREIHKTIAQAIELVYPAVPEQYARLAYHWGQVGDAPKTVYHATLAGRQALRSGSYRQAIEFFEQALALAAHVPLNAQQLGELYSQIGDAQWGQTAMSQSRQSHLHALELLGFPVPGRPRQLMAGSLRALAGHLWGRIAKHRTAAVKAVRAVNMEALLIAAKSFDQIAQGTYHDANMTLGMYCILNGIDAAERAGDSPPAVQFQVRHYSTLGIGMGDLALHRIARAYYGLAESRLPVADDPETTAWFKFAYGMYEAGRGQWDACNQLIGDSLAQSKATGNVRRWLQASEFNAYILILQSRFAEAGEALEAPGQIALHEGHIQSIGRFHIGKTHLLLMLGKTQEARAQYFEHEAAIAESLDMSGQVISKIAAAGNLTILHLRDEEWDAALRSAETLNQLFDSAQTLSFMLASEASASIALYLTLWEKHGKASYSPLVQGLFKQFHRKYTRLYNIGEPVEYAYQCWYAWLRGDDRRARTVGTLAIQAARTYKMPYYEATAHYHLGRFMTADDPDRATHLNAAAEIFEAIGAAYDAERVREVIQK